MSIERTKSKQKVKEPKTKITWKEIKRQKVLLFWAAIMVVYGVVFYYLPLAGRSPDLLGVKGVKHITYILIFNNLVYYGVKFAIFKKRTYHFLTFFGCHIY